MRSVTNDPFPAALRGMAQTVLGPVEPGQLGRTMMHEHIVVEMPHVAKPPDDPAARTEFYAPLTLETLGRIRFGGIANCDNCNLTDAATASAELRRYCTSGGRTVVDATSIGIGRNPAALAQIARATGLHIVMGSSYYVEETYPADHRVHETSEAEIAARIVGELRDGVGETGVRPGLIGEVGCSWPITPTEIKVLRASALAQRESGAPLMIHPGRHGAAPFEIVEILRAAGADLSRTVLCHIDRTIADRQALRRLAETGCIIEFDLFGSEGSYYAWSLPVDMPNDAARINLLGWLIAEGFGAQLVVAHDICFKDKLAAYGGHGYAHILENVVPLMRRKGVAEDAIEAMLVETPRRLLAFA